MQQMDVGVWVLRAEVTILEIPGFTSASCSHACLWSEVCYLFSRTKEMSWICQYSCLVLALHVFRRKMRQSNWMCLTFQSCYFLVNSQFISVKTRTWRNDHRCVVASPVQGTRSFDSQLVPCARQLSRHRSSCLHVQCKFLRPDMATLICKSDCLIWLGYLSLLSNQTEASFCRNFSIEWCVWNSCTVFQEELCGDTWIQLALHVNRYFPLHFYLCTKTTGGIRKRNLVFQWDIIISQHWWSEKGNLTNSMSGVSVFFSVAYIWQEVFWSSHTFISAGIPSVFWGVLPSVQLF